MSFSVHYDFRVFDRFSGPLQKMNRSLEKHKAKIDKAAKSAAKYGKKMESVGKAMSVGVSLPILAAGTAAVVAAAKVETMTVSFESMLGSAKDATEMMSDLMAFSAGTPFQLPGIASAAKRLLAFKVEAKDMTDRLRMLGDVAAGTDQPLVDIAAIFGKIKAKGKAMTEEIMQLAERGVPIIDVLAEKMGKPKEAILELASKSKVSFAVVLDALKGMTGKGGVFFQQMEKQSKTLGGVFSTLKDNIFLFSSEMGKVIVDVFGLKDAIKSFTGFMEKATERIKSFAQNHPKLTKFIAIATAIVVALGPLVAILGAVMVSLPFIIAGFTALFSPIGAVVAAIAGAVAVFGYWTASGHPLISMLGEMWNLFTQIISPIGAFFDMIGLGSGAISVLSGLMDLLGRSVMLMLAPIKSALHFLAGIVNTATALVNLDFSAAGDAIKSAFSGIVGSFTSPFDDAATNVNINNAEKIKNERTSQNVNVGGTIRVSADKGSTVSAAEPDLNTGANVAFAY